MLLKNIVIALLVANFGYFSYSQGWLNEIIGVDSGQREPERTNRQVNPNAVMVSIAPKTEQVLPSPQAPSQLNEPTVVPAAAQPKPPQPEACATKREQWVIYMGPYATPLLRDQKKAELAKLGLVSTFISKQSLQKGLSLGEFDTEEAAKQKLIKLKSKGVKTANIVLWSTINCP